MSVRVIRTQFDPRKIANLTGWYDALDAAGYVESSGQITDWLDKSGRGNAVTQTTANNRPTLFESSGNVQNSTPAVINGRQALFFDGVNDTLSTQNTVTSSHSRTVLAVSRANSYQSLRTLGQFGSTGTGGGNRFVFRYGLNGAAALVSSDTTALNQAIGSAQAWDTNNVSCWSQESSARNVSYFFNGSSLPITSGNPPNAQTAFGGLVIGNATTFNSPFLGCIGEILIYDRQLSAEERNAVTRYLGVRWGITVS